MLMLKKQNIFYNAEYLPSAISNTFVREGKKYYQAGSYSKSVVSFSKALELNSDNKIALIERAYAYFKLGRYDLALFDADESLKDNKSNLKALYIKAEALYAKGEFELALVFYHRCKKISQDGNEFQIGINKAQEAIEKMSKKNNPTQSLVEKYDYIRHDQTKSAITYNHENLQKMLNENLSLPKKAIKESPGVAKNLLGELYIDKVYLENLLKDFVIHNKIFDKSLSRNHPRIRTAHSVLEEITNQGLNFLNTRKEFWKHQKKLNQTKLESKLKDNSLLLSNQLSYILKKLKEIDKCLDDEKYNTAVNKAELLLEFIKPLSRTKLNEKDDLKATIFSNIGSAYLELGKFDIAMKAFKKDLELSLSSVNKSGISRAYENIGRVHAKTANYTEAIDIWEKKIPFIESDREKAWLFHEMAHCYIELEDYHTAKEYGVKTLEAAHKISDDGWKLNALVLLALCHVRLKGSLNLNEAIQNFQQAFEISQQQNDLGAKEAIKKALDDTKKTFQRLSIEPNKIEKPKLNEFENAPIEFVQSQELFDSRHVIFKNESVSGELNRKENSILPLVADKSTNQKILDNLVTYRIELKFKNSATKKSEELTKISFYGTSGDILSIPFNKNLCTNINSKDDYYYANFTFKEKPIGKIQKIKISYDQASLKEAWKLDHVKIKYQNESIKFILNRNENSNNIRFSLLPLSSN